MVKPKHTGSTHSKHEEPTAKPQHAGNSKTRQQSPHVVRAKSLPLRKPRVSEGPVLRPMHSVCSVRRAVLVRRVRHASVGVGVVVPAPLEADA